MWKGISQLRSSEIDKRVWIAWILRGVVIPHVFAILCILQHQEGSEKNVNRKNHTY